MATSALRWFQAALVLQAILLAYWMAIEVVDLSPWNDLAARGPDPELGRRIALIALPQLGCIVLFAFGLRTTAVAAVLGYAAYLGAQLWIWWKPYVLGADADWLTRYARLYAGTLKLLPSEGLRVAPDAQHLMLQALLVATVATMAMAISRMRYL